jgi:hypothetical protein
MTFSCGKIVNIVDERWFDFSAMRSAPVSGHQLTTIGASPAA